MDEIGLSRKTRDALKRVAARRALIVGIGLAILAFTVTALATASTNRNSKVTSGSVSDTLVVDIGAEPGSLDPLMATDGPRDTFSNSVLQGLTARQGGKVVPSLAVSWKAQGNGWIFKLRQGVKFHNGATLTAQDVVASYKRILSPKSQLLGEFVSDDMHVQAINNSTIKISRPTTYADPTIPVRASLVMIEPASLASPPSNGALAETMVGTGPYKFDQWNKGSSIDLSAFSDYWGKKPAIANVTVKFSPEASVRLAALQTGEVELVNNMPPDLRAGLGKELKVVGSPASQVLTMRLNANHGVLMDKRVRLAVDISIDRQQIIKQIYGGYATSAHGQMFTDAVFGFDKSMQDPPFDLKRATQLVQQAGATGKELRLIATQGRWPNDSEVAEAITAMINRTGLKVKLAILPYDTWVKEVVLAGHDDDASPDMVISNDSDELFDASAINQIITCEGGAATICDKTVDALSKKADATSNVAKRASLYHQRSRRIQSEHYLVYVANVYNVAFAANNLKWTPDPDGFLRFQEMSFSS